MNFVSTKQKLSLISIIAPNLKLISFFVSEIQAFLVKYRPVCKTITKQVIKTKMVSIDFKYDGLSLYKVSTSNHFWNLSYKPVCKIHILVNLVCKMRYETKAIINIYYGTKFQHYTISGIWVIINFNKFENFTEPSAPGRTPNHTLPSWGKWANFQTIYGFYKYAIF